MEMETVKLQVNDGLKRYELNEKVTLTFNPTDADFFGRVYDTFSALSKKQSGLEAERKNVKPEEVFEFARKVNSEMRDTIDGLFGPSCDRPDVCNALFRDMNVYALAGGLPVWCNLLFAIMDEADTSISKEQMMTDPAIKKYTAKYHR